MPIGTETAILIGAGLATTGWLYTARRARTLARKQHTFNMLLKAGFDKEFRDALATLSPYLKNKKLPDFETEEGQKLRAHLRLLLNHYEFVSAAIRNGDLDERLIHDSERGTILTIVECSAAYIEGMRTSRRRMSIYEHLEWLHRRWESKPPKLPQRILESCRGRPFVGKRIDVLPTQ